MLQWVTTLAHLHTSEPALACGAEQVLYSDAETLVTLRDTAHANCVQRPLRTERVLVAVHRGPAAKVRVPLEKTWAAGCEPMQDLLPGATQGSIAENALQLQFAADDVWISRCR